MFDDLDGKSALITGASSEGFGAHFARVLARHGTAVTVAARRLAPLEVLVEEIRKEGGCAQALAFDVTDVASVRKAISSIGPPDILINNAGISRTGPALDQTEAEYDSVLDTNLKGAWFVAAEVARAMRGRDKGGSIVNIASILGLRQMKGAASYAVAKAGVIQMTHQLGLEFARFRIRVNAIAPGFFASDINRDFLATDAGKAMMQRVAMRRFGEYRDLEGALLLLASDASAFMTGSVIVVDGGHCLSSL
jgi:NAD(P)-dependent dehydrogenase (short-subunit alcohol dehydrogenase family)